MKQRLPLPIFACVGLLALLPACRATYPSGNVRQAIAAMCQKEYGVQVQVLTAGKTIGAVLTTNNLLQSDLSLSDKALEKIEHVMLTVSRVALSSETPYEFFVIAAQDRKAGLQVTFVRYLKDIRRLLTDDISRNEYFQRMLIEVSLLPPTSGEPTLKEYSLSEFLVRQISDRLRQQIDQNTVVTRLFGVQDVEGKYVPVRRKGERAALSGVLRMVVTFHPQAPAFETVATPALRESFTRLFLRNAQTLTRRYDFFGYEGLELVDGKGRRLAYFDRKEFTKDTVNTLMELIKSIKDKSSAK